MKKLSELFLLQFQWDTNSIAPGFGGRAFEKAARRKLYIIDLLIYRFCAIRVKFLDELSRSWGGLMEILRRILVGFESIIFEIGVENQ